MNVLRNRFSEQPDDNCHHNAYDNLDENGLCGADRDHRDCHRSTDFSFIDRCLVHGNIPSNKLIGGIRSGFLALSECLPQLCIQEEKRWRCRETVDDSLCEFPLLAHGLTVGSIHKYFSDLEMRKCVPKLSRGRRTHRGLPVIRESNDLTCKTEESGDTAETEQRDAELYRHVFLCLKMPILANLGLVKSYVTANRTLPETLPEKTSAVLGSEETGLIDYSEYEETEFLNVAHRDLQNHLKKIFGLPSSSTSLIEQEVKNSFSKKRATVVLVEEFVSQLSTIERNTHPHYHPDAFRSSHEYDIWQQQARCEVIDHINQFWSYELPNVSDLFISSLGERFSEYRRLTELVISYEIEYHTRHTHEMLSHGPFTMASQWLLKEFSIKCGIGRLYHYACLLHHLAERFDSSHWFLTSAHMTLKSLQAFLPNQADQLIATSQEFELLRAAVSWILKHCENYLCNIRQLFPENKPLGCVELLLDMLAVVLELNSYFCGTEVQNVSLCVDTIVKRMADQSYQRLRRFEGQALNTCKLSPTFLNAVCIGVRDEVADIRRYYEKDFLPLHIDITRLVAVHHFERLAEDVRQLCDQRLHEFDPTLIDQEMMGLAFRLDQLDRDWQQYGVKGHAWRELLVLHMWGWVKILKRDMRQKVLASLSNERFTALRLRRASLHSVSWSSDSRQRSGSLKSLTPSTHSAFQPVVPNQGGRALSRESSLSSQSHREMHRDGPDAKTLTSPTTERLRFTGSKHWQKRYSDPMSVETSFTNTPKPESNYIRPSHPLPVRRRHKKQRSDQCRIGTSSDTSVSDSLMLDRTSGSSSTRTTYSRSAGQDCTVVPDGCTCLDQISTVPFSSSLVDLIVILNRTEGFAQTIADTICPMGKTPADGCDQLKEMRFFHLELLIKVVCSIVRFYINNLHWMDICALPAEKKLEFITLQPEDLHGRTWHCRHSVAGVECQPYVNTSALYLADKYECVTSEMCMRINNVSSMIEFLPEYYRRIHKSLSGERAIGLHSGRLHYICPQRAANKQMPAESVLSYQRKISQNSTDTTASTICSTVSFDSVPFQACCDHVKDVHQRLIELLAFRINLFVADTLSLLLSLKRIDWRPDRLLQPLTSFLLDHINFLRKNLYSMSFIQVMSVLWRLIVRDFEEHVKEMAALNQDDVHATCLLQAVTYLMKFLTNHVPGLDADEMLMIADLLVFKLQLYTFSTKSLILLFCQLNEQEKRHDALSVWSESQSVRKRYLDRMKRDLHSIRKSFSGPCLLKWIMANPTELLVMVPEGRMTSSGQMDHKYLQKRARCFAQQLLDDKIIVSADDDDEHSVISVEQDSSWSQSDSNGISDADLCESSDEIVNSALDSNNNSCSARVGAKGLIKPSALRCITESDTREDSASGSSTVEAASTSSVKELLNDPSSHNTMSHSEIKHNLTRALDDMPAAVPKAGKRGCAERQSDELAEEQAEGHREGNSGEQAHRKAEEHEEGQPMGKAEEKSAGKVMGQTDEQLEGKAEGQMISQARQQTDGQVEWPTREKQVNNGIKEVEAVEKIEEHLDGQAERQVKGQIEEQVDRHTEGQVYVHTEGQVTEQTEGDIVRQDDIRAKRQLEGQSEVQIEGEAEEQIRAQAHGQSDTQAKKQGVIPLEYGSNPDPDAFVEASPCISLERSFEANEGTADEQPGRARAETLQSEALTVRSINSDSSQASSMFSTGPESYYRFASIYDDFDMHQLITRERRHVLKPMTNLVLKCIEKSIKSHDIATILQNRVNADLIAKLFLQKLEGQADAKKREPTRYFCFSA